MNLRKWSQRDLNPRPFDYESIALTNCAMGPGGWYTKKKKKQDTITCHTSLLCSVGDCCSYLYTYTIMKPRMVKINKVLC